MEVSSNNLSKSLEEFPDSKIEDFSSKDDLKESPAQEISLNDALNEEIGSKDSSTIPLKVSLKRQAIHESITAEEDKTKKLKIQEESSIFNEENPPGSPRDKEEINGQVISITQEKEIKINENKPLNQNLIENEVSETSSHPELKDSNNKIQLEFLDSSSSEEKPLKSSLECGDDQTNHTIENLESQAVTELIEDNNSAVIVPKDDIAIMDLKEAQNSYSTDFSDPSFSVNDDHIPIENITNKSKINDCEESDELVQSISNENTNFIIEAQNSKINDGKLSASKIEVQEQETSSKDKDSSTKLKNLNQESESIEFKLVNDSEIVTNKNCITENSCDSPITDCTEELPEENTITQLISEENPNMKVLEENKNDNGQVKVIEMNKSDIHEIETNLKPNEIELNENKSNDTPRLSPEASVYSETESLNHKSDNSESNSEYETSDSEMETDKDIDSKSSLNAQKLSEEKAKNNLLKISELEKDWSDTESVEKEDNSANSNQKSSEEESLRIVKNSETSSTSENMIDPSSVEYPVSPPNEINKDPANYEDINGLSSNKKDESIISNDPEIRNFCTAADPPMEVSIPINVEDEEEVVLASLAAIEAAVQQADFCTNNENPLIDKFSNGPAPPTPPEEAFEGDLEIIDETSEEEEEQDVDIDSNINKNLSLEESVKRIEDKTPDSPPAIMEEVVDEFLRESEDEKDTEEDISKIMDFLQQTTTVTTTTTTTIDSQEPTAKLTTSTSTVTSTKLSMTPSEVPPIVKPVSLKRKQQDKPIVSEPPNKSSCPPPPPKPIKPLNVLNWEKVLKVPYLDSATQKFLFSPSVVASETGQIMPKEDEFVCPGCYDRFYIPNSFFQHVYRQSIQISFNCKPCNSTISLKNICHFRIHLLCHLEEQGVDEFVTDFINVSPLIENCAKEDFLDLLSKETWNNDSPKCSECRLNFTSLEEHYEKIKIIKSCPQNCGIVLPNSCALSAHIRVHSKIGPKICPECGKGFETQIGFKDHVLNFCFHGCKKRTKKCKICKKNILASKLLDHIRESHIRLLYKCGGCSKAFVTMTKLEQHKIGEGKEHKDQSILYRAPFLKPPSNVFASLDSLMDRLNRIVSKWEVEKLTPICNGCGHSFKSMEEARSHDMRWCSVQANQAPPGLNLFTEASLNVIPPPLPKSPVSDCTECFKLKEDLQTHLNSHSSSIESPPKLTRLRKRVSLPSPITPKSVSKTIPISSKPTSISSKESPAPSLTPKSSKKRVKIIKPFVEALGVDLPEVPNLLSFNLLSGEALSLGSTVSHRDRKKSHPFNCYVCSFKSKCKEEFDMHIRTHKDNQEDGHQCKTCGMSFASEPSWKKHLFLIHKIRNPGPEYYCEDLTVPMDVLEIPTE